MLQGDWQQVMEFSSFDSAISWRAHLIRDWEKQRRFFEDGVPPHLLSTVFAWAPVLYSTWSADWIEGQRQFSQNNARQCMDSRLFRRACVGHVHRRWAEGVSWAMAERET